MSEEGKMNLQELTEIVEMCRDWFNNEREISKTWEAEIMEKNVGKEMEIWIKNGTYPNGNYRETFNLKFEDFANQNKMPVRHNATVVGHERPLYQLHGGSIGTAYTDESKEINTFTEWQNFNMFLGFPYFDFHESIRFFQDGDSLITYMLHCIIHEVNKAYLFGDGCDKPKGIITSLLSSNVFNINKHNAENEILVAASAVKHLGNNEDYKWMGNAATFQYLNSIGFRFDLDKHGIINGHMPNMGEGVCLLYGNFKYYIIRERFDGFILRRSFDNDNIKVCCTMRCESRYADIDSVEMIGMEFDKDLTNE